MIAYELYTCFSKVLTRLHVFVYTVIPQVSIPPPVALAPIWSVPTLGWVSEKIATTVQNVRLELFPPQKKAL